MNESPYQLSVAVNESDHIQGSEHAKITLVEYGDYQCPYCGQGYGIVKQLQEYFGDSLRFVFRNFPLTQIHAFALGAAEAAEVSGEFGKFWEMHDMLFENQKELAPPFLVSYASKIGIHEAEFVKKMSSQAEITKIKSDFMSGVESGVNGTPSFFVNGNKYDGPWDFDTFKSVLEEMI